MFAVKTEGEMTAIVAGVKKISRKNLPLSKLRKSLLVSRMRRFLFVSRPRKKKKLLYFNWKLKRKSELQGSNLWRRCA